MFVRLHAFDWMVYSERVMPAFASWLVEDDESAVEQLYQETRSARGEQFVPAAVKHLCIWPRAQAFVKQLPRGSQAKQEYQNLCAAELFTALSDRYIRQYPPRLYQDSEALRSVWGAIVEQFCLPWFQHSPPQDDEETSSLEKKEQEPETPTEDELEADRSELISLLQSAGLERLARQVSEQAVSKSYNIIEQSAFPVEDIASWDETGIPDEERIPPEDDDTGDAPRGIVIGRQPAGLHMRGWLATISVRTMVLFEFLACGRRSMPFGYHAGEPFEGYIGYLTPDEIWQMALLLGDVEPPDAARAREEARNFHDQLSADWDEFRLIDEVLPEHAAEFLQAIHNAAQQGLGLICSIG
ncbi:MAG: hypothetical protein JO011_18025 [Ktedonobacteraceae bacterium]|nr:hypothetical protein [Ktedonobacteraceae bacterium]